MEEIRSNDWDELCLLHAKRAKKVSREIELTILQCDFLSEEEQRESAELQRKYRRSLDEDIERHKQNLIERYGEVAV